MWLVERRRARHIAQFDVATRTGSAHEPSILPGSAEQPSVREPYDASRIDEHDVGILVIGAHRLHPRDHALQVFRARGAFEDLPHHGHQGSFGDGDRAITDALGPPGRDLARLDTNHLFQLFAERHLEHPALRHVGLGAYDPDDRAKHQESCHVRTGLGDRMDGEA